MPSPALAGRATLLGALVLPIALTIAAPAGADTGGLAATGVAAPASGPATPSTAPATASGSALRPTAEIPGVGSWRASATTRVGHAVVIRGTLDKSLARHTVRVERRTPSGRWLRATKARVRTNGHFVARWRTRATRYHELRLRVGSGRARARAASTEDATVRILVVKSTRATWYGPGFYGHRTACGVTLTPTTVGVAHRTLPCGTKVEIHRHGHRVVVPVIDRGPYGTSASLDLTKPVADELDVDGVDGVTFLERRDLERSVKP